MLIDWSPLYELFLSNSLAAYMRAIVITVIAWAVFRGVQWLVLKRLIRLTRRTGTDLDDMFIRVVSNIKPQVYTFLALYLGVRTLVLPATLDRAATLILLAVLAYQITATLRIVIDYGVRRRLHSDVDEEDPNATAVADMVSMLASVVLWSIAVLFVLSNAGINVTSLLASLGIGGIAVALALQNVLGDLFSSLAIYLDRPFAIGDTVKVGTIIGKVKHIGIKTTRLKALAGEEVVISNRELTSARINNFGRMETRRVEFRFGVTYETSSDLLQEVPRIVEEVITGIEQTEFKRVHFKSFGDSALTFEVVYNVLEKSYVLYMDIQHDINMALKRRFEEAGIEFAYPTQTVHVRTTS